MKCLQVLQSPATLKQQQPTHQGYIPQLIQHHQTAAALPSDYASLLRLVKNIHHSTLHLGDQPFLQQPRRACSSSTSTNLLHTSATPCRKFLFRRSSELSQILALLNSTVQQLWPSARLSCEPRMRDLQARSTRGGIFSAVRVVLQACLQQPATLTAQACTSPRDRLHRHSCEQHSNLATAQSCIRRSYAQSGLHVWGIRSASFQLGRKSASFRSLTETRSTCPRSSIHSPPPSQKLQNSPASPLQQPLSSSPNCTANTATSNFRS